MTKRATAKAILEAVETTGGYTKAAKKLTKAGYKIGVAQVRATFEKAKKPEVVVPKGAKLLGRKVVPLSEDVRKYKEDWTKEDCIAELQQIAEDHKDQVISRNFFRVHSDISESTWNRYFGTFQEFKRQANIILSRHAHRMERNIAKHASVDILREMNVDKAGWEGKYLKPSGKRFKTVLVCSDVHDKECDPFYRRLFIETANRVKPDVIFFNGDIFDLPEFSKHLQDPREFDVVGRIKWVHRFLADLRKVCPDAEFILIEGNHEFRLMRHLAEQTQALKTVLADLHGFTVSKLLGLDTYEVNYIARADLTAFNERDIGVQIRKNWFILWQSVLGHHFPNGKDMGYPGWNGHHHKHIVTPFYSPIFGPYEWHQLGAGHRREASYCNGENWGNGFLMVHVDTEKKTSCFEYIQIQDHVVIGGKWYQRTAAEIVTGL